ncbi:uncharacterized protein PG998_001391 [Apiospora kogelbergensis]|uniref:Uncharacterized protein n=1 Tax=Apiospora kogelbergensis TaxID=1337665 RepID=A0AAW0QQL4_9PEZI
MPGQDSTPQTGKSDFNIQPVDPKPQGASNTSVAAQAHQAHPGPAIPQSMPEQEGTKEERLAKAKELNK